MSCMTVSPRHAWHWNHMHHGAVAYGEAYCALERPRHFRGVIETNLREVILEIWPKVDRAFATEGAKAHDDHMRRRREPPRQ